MIRVGRRIFKNGKWIDPSFPGFTPVLVLMKSHSKWGELGPYLLKNDKNQIMENIWQFAKVYEKVPKTIQYYSQYDKTVIWSHPAENHYSPETDELSEEYWNWREKGFNNKYAVRYPLGFGNQLSGKCLFALQDGNDKKLDYIEARKRIYYPVYSDLVKKQPKFLELKEKLRKENLLIIEIDGPHSESLKYYKDTYGVNDDFIERDTMLINEENICIMLNDSKHPFGLWPEARV